MVDGIFTKTERKATNYASQSASSLCTPPPPCLLNRMLWVPSAEERSALAPSLGGAHRAVTLALWLYAAFT